MDLKIFNTSDDLNWPCLLETYVREHEINNSGSELPLINNIIIKGECKSSNPNQIIFYCSTLFDNVFFEFIKLLGSDAESVMVSLSRMSIL